MEITNQDLFTMVTRNTVIITQKEGHEWTDSDHAQIISAALGAVIHKDQPAHFIIPMMNRDFAELIADDMQEWLRKMSADYGIEIIITHRETDDGVIIMDVWVDNRADAIETCPTCDGKGELPCKGADNLHALCWTCGGDRKVTPLAARAAAHNTLDSADVIAYKELDEQVSRSDFITKLITIDKDANDG